MLIYNNIIKQCLDYNFQIIWIKIVTNFWLDIKIQYRRQNYLFKKNKNEIPKSLKSIPKEMVIFYFIYWLFMNFEGITNFKLF